MESSKTLIRAVVALFAAIVGFGLKTLLEVRPGISAEMTEHRWLLFVILLMLVFRFVCGASVHLAELYAERVLDANRISFDLFSLVLFAVCLLQVTLATSLDDFFLRLTIPIAAAVAWAGVQNKYWEHPLARSFWRINVPFLASLWFVWLLDRADLPAAHVLDWALSVVLVLIVSVVAAVADIRGQMQHLVLKTQEKMRLELERQRANTSPAVN